MLLLITTMKKHFLLYIAFFFINCAASFSQSNAELFHMGEVSFNSQNYAAAAHFYKQIIINIDSGNAEFTRPYGINPYSGSGKKKKKRDAKNPADSSSAVGSTDVKADSTSANAKADSDSSNTVPNINPEKLRAMEKLALSYRLAHSYENSEVWYKKLYDLSPANANYSYDYGKALMMNGKYKPAMDLVNNLMQDQEVGTEAFNKSRDLVKSCGFAIKATENKNKYLTLTPSDTAINARGGAFAASYAEEGSILFSSARPLSSKGDVQATNSNIYKVLLDNKGKSADEIKSVSPMINSENNEGAGVLSPDKNKLYFTRWNYDAENPECAIYVSKFFNGQWLTPRKLGDKINVPGYRSMHPSLSPDGTTLYFSSDRPGGLGKFDIWYCKLDEADNTTEVLNPGKNVNTRENEETPYLHPMNFLYFSSDGHPGLGGLDVFKVQLEEGAFVLPVKNLGSPMNSSHDDAYYISDPTSQIGFISSDRRACAECGDGNCYEIYYFIDKPIVVTISGKVFVEETNEPLANCMVSFIDVSETYDPIFVFTDDKGDYKTLLNREVEYYATAQKIGFFKDAVTLNTMNIKQSTDLIQDFNFQLKTIPAGAINIPGIEYDLGSATLRPHSKIILDSLVDFLNLNDNLVVEISSHTDVRGSDVSNMILSEARAKSVVDYLIEHGIEKERLVAKGYGETKPLVDAKTEEEHQRNRRTAFQMLSQDFKPVDKYKYLKTRPKSATPQSTDTPTK